MPSSGNGKNRARPRRRVSGARGGPATGGGLNYQNDYGLLHALYLIGYALGDPLTQYVLHIEPRVVSDDVLTAWDLRIQPPDVQIEAKLNPDRADVLEFLARVARAQGAGIRREYRLVHGQAPPLLVPLNKLLRLAQEARGIAARFDLLLDAEGREGTEELIEQLGDSPLDVLRNIALEQLSDKQLAREIRLAAESLAGPVGGLELINLLSRKISLAVPRRASFLAHDLITEARHAGIQLAAPPNVASPGLSPVARTAIFVLQSCPDGLPLSVVAAAACCSSEQLQAVLTPLADRHLLEVREERMCLSALPNPLSHPEPEEINARTLEALLDFIRTHTPSAQATSQIRNALLLAQECLPTRPKSVAPIFASLHRPLKSQGNKRQILDIARLTVAATRKIGPNRPDEMVHYEAQAVICGESWVYQRIDKLAQAMALAHESLELGQKVRYHRNTYFCRKCIGRLFRMQAEEEDEPTKRADLFRRSVESLRAAIDGFGSDHEGGPDWGEVGDSWSLLGRTLLASGDIARTRDAIAEAEQLLTDPANKDFVDLLILRGDLAARVGDRDSAELLYTDALEVPTYGDAQKNEIRARAYFYRARNRQAQGRKTEAVSDYKQAAGVWTRLDERERAAEAHWYARLLTDPPPSDVRERLSSQSFSVRLMVLEQRQEELARLPRSYVGRRSDPPGSKYWDRLIAEAQNKDACQTIEW